MFEVSSKIKEIIHASPFLQRTSSSHSVVLVRLIIIWTSLLLISSNMKKVSSPAAVVLLLALSLYPKAEAPIFWNQEREGQSFVFALLRSSTSTSSTTIISKLWWWQQKKRRIFGKNFFGKREKNQQQQWHWKLKKEAIWKEAVCTTKKKSFWTISAKSDLCGHKNQPLESNFWQLLWKSSSSKSIFLKCLLTSCSFTVLKGHFGLLRGKRGGEGSFSSTWPSLECLWSSLLSEQEGRTTSTPQPL